jgi:hypothetical protein
MNAPLPACRLHARAATAFGAAYARRAIDDDTPRLHPTSRSTTSRTTRNDQQQGAAVNTQLDSTQPDETRLDRVDLETTG